MIKIKEKYVINKETLALLPAGDIEYNTVVIENDKKLFVQQTSLQIIKASCLEDWSTLEGKQKAVMHHTGFRKKLPIPLNIHKGIYFFPTHSKNSIHNSWIAFHHIIKFVKLKKDETEIYFKNNKHLTLQISSKLIEKQMERTFNCMYRINNMMNNKW